MFGILVSEKLGIQVRHLENNYFWGVWGNEAIWSVGFRVPCLGYMLGVGLGFRTLGMTVPKTIHSKPKANLDS